MTGFVQLASSQGAGLPAGGEAQQDWVRYQPRGRANSDAGFNSCTAFSYTFAHPLSPPVCVI